MISSFLGKLFPVKFGLAQAFQFLKAKPDANRDGVSHGLALLQTVGVEVTVGEEISSMKSELQENLDETGEIVQTARDSLGTVENEKDAAVGKLRSEGTVAKNAVNQAATGKKDRISDRTDARTERLQKRIDALEDRAARKQGGIDARASTARDTIQRQLNNQISQAESDAKSDLDAAHASISAAEEEIAKLQDKLGDLQRVKELFS